MKETSQTAELGLTLRARPHLIYLTTEYPHVSHTFIRREILELERLGYRIDRVALRSGSAIVDAEDVSEQGLTLHLLERPLTWLAATASRGAWLAGIRLRNGMAAAMRLSRASERGLMRHAAYLVEALVLLAVAKRCGAQHVHVHFGTNAASIAHLASLMGGPSFSMTVHGPDEFDAPIGFSLGWKIETAAFAIAISSFGRAQMQRWVPFSSWSKLHVVHCTVGGDWFKAATDLRGHEIDLVCVGRLSEQKGQLLLIDAFADAVEAGLRGRLVLVGDGELRPAIESKARARGISDRVVLAGWCSGAEVREHLLRARALVLPSFAEGLPVVIMESMALRRPVLSTAVMGIPELVQDGQNGWLVTPGDREGLADALLRIDRTSVDCLRQMGLAAQKRVLERHATASQVSKLDELFQRYSTG